jgi:hypothetical protein
LSATAPQAVRVTPADFGAAKEPQIAVDGSTIYVAYGLEDAVYVSSSTDAGKSFGAPVKVGSAGKLSLGMRRGPRIAARNGNLTITAIYGVQGRGKDENLVAFRSSDRGKSWSSPATVNSYPASAREGLHAMAQSPDGTVACSWLDLRGAGTELYLATSKDFGASWSDNRILYTSPSGTICECCHPSLAFDARGGLHALFRNSTGGARDMFLISSRDGRNFGGAAKLGCGTWMLKACPMDGGMLAVGKDGTVRAVWRRDGTVYWSGATGAERALGEGRDPWMAMAMAGSVPVYVWKSGKGLVWSRAGGRAQTLTEVGQSPVVAAAGDDKSVYAAWGNSGILFARVPL